MPFSLRAFRPIRLLACASVVSAAPFVGCTDVVEALVEAKQRRRGESAPTSEVATAGQLAGGADASGSGSSLPMPTVSPSTYSPPVPTTVALGPAQIDLQPYATSDFRRFEGLPSGDQRLGGVDFRIGGQFLALQGSGHLEYPRAIDGIAVDRPCQTMHFLHATMDGGFGPRDPSRNLAVTPSGDGQEIGEYVIRYEDGTTERIALKYGEDLRDWWDWDQGAPTSRGETVWTGTHPPASGFNLKVRLYKLTWTNPQPQKSVRAIDFRSFVGRAAPFCLAITVDGGTTTTMTPSAPAPVAIPSSSQLEPPSSPVRAADKDDEDWSFPHVEKPPGTTDAARSGVQATASFTLPPPGPLDATAWTRAKERLVADRQRTIGDAVEAFETELSDAKVKATLDAREADAAQLEADAAALRIDPFKLPKAKDGKLAARSYVDDRIDLEREALASFTGLKDRAPSSLPAAELATIDKEIAAVESALAKLTLSQRLLASAAPSDRGSARSASSDDERFLAPEPVHWEIVVDAPKSRSVAGAANLIGRRLENVLPEHAYYPPGAPTVMFIATGTQDVTGFRLVDLKTLDAMGPDLKPDKLKKKSGAIGRFADHMTLSDDASKLATLIPGEEMLLVADDRTEKISLIKWEGTNPYLMFLPDDRLLALDRGRTPSVQALQLPKGTVLSKSMLIHPPSDDPGLVTASPGGRYLVLTDGKQDPTAARFFDLEEGRHAGALELAAEGVTAHFRCFAFNHDGAEFAAYMTTPSGSRAMVVWDVKSGRPTYVRRIEGAGDIDLQVASDHPLQWFPDGRGWLLLQRYVIDREGAAVTQTIEGYFDPVYRQNGAKILNDRYVLTADGQHAMHVIEVARHAPKP